jgi:hypothetical protein
MSIKGFGLFWYDFIIGDDWRIAVIAAAALAVTGALAHGHAASWWLLPLAVVAALAFSLWRAIR